MTLVARDLWAAPPGAPEAVIRGVSLDVRAGEWLALTGPNGGGKSTLALALAGLLPTVRGRVEWEGAVLAPATRHAIRPPIAVVLQDPSAQLFAPTVEDEIALTARNLGDAESAIADDVRTLADQLGLTALRTRDPRTLSAGHQQRVLLAAALASRPALLVADEPLAHADPEGRALALEAVSGRVRAGLAVVWVTQNTEEAARAHRALEVAAGRVGPRTSVAAASGPAGKSLDRESASAAEALAPPLEIEPAGRAEGARIEIAALFRADLPRRGLVRIEGANGVGKSVLLRALAGLIDLPQVRLPRWPGRPLLCGQYPEREIFEEEVAAEVVFAAVSRGRGVAEVREEAEGHLARLCGDSESARALLGRRTWTLSGGEKRLVQLVSLLVAPADPVLLDEPTGGLDPERSRIAWQLLHERAVNSLVVVATQDLVGAGIGPASASICLGRPRASDSPSCGKKTD